MLYVGTPAPLPATSTPDLRIEPVDEPRTTVRGWFSQPYVNFVGAHTGCSCGFPSVTADVAIEYFDGMRLDSDHRDADLRSVRALIDLLREAAATHDVELYPIADGSESTPPKGVIAWRMDSLQPEQFFFNEGFMHVVRRAP